MITKEIRQVRCDDALRLLTLNGRAVFFTLTTEDVVDYHTIRERWRGLRHDLLRDLRRSGVEAQYVMNYELHPGYLQKLVSDRHGGEILLRSDGKPHGWHIHGVINAFIPLLRYRALLDKNGFGRTDVRWVTSRGVADYLTKHALKAYRGLTRKDKAIYKGMRLRLVNTSRGLPPLSDYRYTSDLIETTHHLMTLAREDEIMLRSQGVILEKPDYRKIHQQAEIAAMLRLGANWQVQKMIELAQTMKTTQLLQWLEQEKQKNQKKSDAYPEGVAHP